MILHLCSVRRDDLNFAQQDLGFSCISISDAVSGCFVRISSFGFHPQMHTGHPGGHLQVFAIS